jgi:NhaP-type Na+/H+ or K+/H+ antiporter
MLITILWQCALGTLLGCTTGYFANHLLRYCDSKKYVGRASYLVFYLLLAIFSCGVASTLGVDDFLFAFSAGATFSRDGWFSRKTSSSNLANVIDLLLNSTMFVYFGTIIPWSDFTLSWPDALVTVTPWRLFFSFVLILVFRRVPAVLLLKKWIPALKTYREALFCGHFGPMGVGALFLSLESRAQLETDRSEVLPHPPPYTSEPPGNKIPELIGRNQRAVEMIWPIICFFVLGSVMVHGLSTLIVSVGIHVRRPHGERAPLIGGETEGIGGMVHSSDDYGSEEDGESGD